MNAEQAFRAFALVMGIVFIVAGAGLANTGYSQMQAADEWDSQTHYCGSASSFEAASQIDCPDNPYEGGEFYVGTGVVLLLIGGVSARWGTQ